MSKTTNLYQAPETMTLHRTLWIGRTLSAFVVLALVADGTVQLFAPARIASMLQETGFAMDLTRIVAPIILACAILYAIPATAVLGAILVTGFFGGAICAHLRIGEVGSPPEIVSLLLGAMTWGGLYARDPRIRALLQVDLVLSDAMRDMIEDRIDLAIRLGPVNQPDAIVRRVGGTPLVCVGSRRYFEQHGTPRTPAELVNHNCLMYGGLVEATNWPFVGPEGRFSVPVHGNFSSNSVETIRAGVLAGVGIGLFAKVSLADELRHPDVISVLDEFLRDVRDVSLIWPNRRYVPLRVRRTTDFFATALQQRI